MRSTSFSATLLLLSIAVILVACAYVVPAYGACDVPHCAACMLNNADMCSNCENGYMISQTYSCELTAEAADSDSASAAAGPCALLSTTAALLLLVRAAVL